MKPNLWLVPQKRLEEIMSALKYTESLGRYRLILSYSMDKSLTVSFTERRKKMQVLRLHSDCGLATDAGHDKGRACEGCILFEGN